MPITPEELVAELRLYAEDLDLSDQQKGKLQSALIEMREKIAEYRRKHPDTPDAALIAMMNEHRAEIRQRLVNFLSPDQLMKWDADALQHRLVMLAGSERDPRPRPDDGTA